MTMLATPLHPPITKGRGREVSERAPEITISRSRRFCSTCMVRKTYWVVAYVRYKNRRCWGCFTPEERAAFREGY